MGAWMSALGRQWGKEIYWPSLLLLSLFLSYFCFFYFFLYFLKKQQKHNGNKNKTKPCLLRGKVVNSGFSGPIGRQASVGCIPAFVSQLNTSGREEDEDLYGKGLLQCSIFVLLSWHSYTFGSRIPVCKSFRRTWIENLILFVGQLHVITREEGKLFSENTSICNWHCPGN